MLFDAIDNKVNQLVVASLPVTQANFIRSEQCVDDEKNQMVGTMDIGTPDTASGKVWVNNYIDTNKLD